MHLYDVNIYIRTYMNTYIRRNGHIHVDVYLYIYLIWRQWMISYTHLYIIYTCIHMYPCICISKFMHVHICYIYMLIYVYLHIYLCVYISIDRAENNGRFLLFFLFAHRGVTACSYLCVYIYTCIYIWSYVYGCLFIYLYMHIYTYTYIYIYITMYMFIHTYISSYIHR